MARKIDTSIRACRTERDMDRTPEPPPGPEQKASVAPIFVVQKHQAHRAGLHWDFRLEHEGVLWSWAIPKGPSLDPSDKRIATHVEDHPLDYANFHGTIPSGNYGAGDVEIWDKGTWRSLSDPKKGLAAGEIKFVLQGTRLQGQFTLIRLKPRPGKREHGDNWLLIKGHDAWERRGADASLLEAETALPTVCGTPDDPPAVPDARPETFSWQQEPQLASVTDEPPEGEDWISEIKFDGYRLLVFIRQGKVRLQTRNFLDWTDRLPSLARAFRNLPVESAIIDGELVALEDSGVSSFPALQAALSAGQDDTLKFFVFDLLHLNGWDLRQGRLGDRKAVLSRMVRWKDPLRFSDHHLGDTSRVRQAACRMHAEGIICKKADAPYRSGRGHDWLKVKCQGREEFVILGWTDPSGSRTALGSIHVGYYDHDGTLHYAGGVGSGFSEDLLSDLKQRLLKAKGQRVEKLAIAGEDLPPGIHWISPCLIAEVSFTAWSGAGRIRHAVFLGLREDKEAAEVVREIADPAADRRQITPGGYKGAIRRRRTIAVPPVEKSQPPRLPRIVTAKAPSDRSTMIDGVRVTHPEKLLWPEVTKQDLVAYWQAIAAQALPGLAKRPMAILRCPDGVDGEHFFQKHGHGMMPVAVREGAADKAPYLAIDGLDGLIALAQMSAVELHVWGAAEAKPLVADQLVFDLDPGEGVKTPAIVQAAQDLRAKLADLGLTGFCRTSGGKGLHVVVPVRPSNTWDEVRTFCHAFAELLSEQAPDRYLAHVKIADRRGRILIDWLRNGLGSTAIGSFSPRARPGATVATPLSWKEVTTELDPSAFNLRTIPARLGKLRSDPWEDFDRKRAPLPASPGQKARTKPPVPHSRTRIVSAKAPRRR